MLILGIESSCDESAVSIVRMERGTSLSILSEVISSQIDLHRAYGGVVPELAAREHLVNLPKVTGSALELAGISLSQVDLVSYTRGPGLKGCLLMGDRFAKALAISSGARLRGVNHVEAHLLSPMIENTELSFPFLGLVVSGGHTELYLVKGLGKYELIARTIDDAAGEAFDKSANLLGIEYPGGAKLAAMADTVSGSCFKLPSVMTGTQGDKAALAFSIQDAIIAAIIRKVKVAVEDCGIRDIAISGGVSANRRLRVELEGINQVRLFSARRDLCTDNATMIAFLGGLYEEQIDQGTTIAHAFEDDLKLEVKARWPVVKPKVL